jgi:integrase
VPTLADFLNKRFIPFCQTAHKDKPNSLRYYVRGAQDLVASPLAKLKLDAISGEHCQQYINYRRGVGPAMVNCGLRILRRALNLAAEWDKTFRAPKLSLAPGEKKRKRVLKDWEIAIYRACCEEPWFTIVICLLGSSCRPSEIFGLTWERLAFGDKRGLLKIDHGKSEAAKRVLPVKDPEALKALKAHHIAMGEPATGWVFPSPGTKCGHMSHDNTKQFHKRAMDRAIDLAKLRGVKLEPFPPYTLRHTALTRLAPLCDAFTLKTIAGHSDIRTTMLYIHPQEHAIEAAFDKMPLLPTVCDSVCDKGSSALITASVQKT